MGESPDPGEQSGVGGRTFPFSAAALRQQQASSCPAPAAGQRLAHALSFTLKVLQELIARPPEPWAFELLAKQGNGIRSPLVAKCLAGHRVVEALHGCRISPRWPDPLVAFSQHQKTNPAQPVSRLAG